MATVCSRLLLHPATSAALHSFQAEMLRALESEDITRTNSELGILMGSPNRFQAEMWGPVRTSPHHLAKPTPTPCWLLSRAIEPSSSLHVLCVNLHEGYRKCVLKNCPLNKFWLNQNIVHNADGDKYSNAIWIILEAKPLIRPGGANVLYLVFLHLWRL